MWPHVNPGAIQRSCRLALGQRHISLRLLLFTDPAGPQVINFENGSYMTKLLQFGVLLLFTNHNMEIKPRKQNTTHMHTHTQALPLLTSLSYKLQNYE